MDTNRLNAITTAIIASFGQIARQADAIQGNMVELLAIASTCPRQDLKSSDSEINRALTRVFKADMRGLGKARWQLVSWMEYHTPIRCEVDNGAIMGIAWGSSRQIHAVKERCGGLWDLKGLEATDWTEFSASEKEKKAPSADPQRGIDALCREFARAAIIAHVGDGVPKVAAILEVIRNKINASDFYETVEAMMKQQYTPASDGTEPWADRLAAHRENERRAAQAATDKAKAAQAAEEAKPPKTETPKPKATAPKATAPKATAPMIH